MELSGPDAGHDQSDQRRPVGPKGLEKNDAGLLIAKGISAFGAVPQVQEREALAPEFDTPPNRGQVVAERLHEVHEAHNLRRRGGPQPNPASPAGGEDDIWLGPRQETVSRDIR